MKKRIIGLLLAGMLVFLPGCVPEQEINGEIVAKTDHYTVIKEETGYVLRFHIPYREPPQEGVFVSYVSELCFESVAEMKEKLLTGNFTESELGIMRHMQCNKNGDTMLFDLENIHQPVLPEGKTYRVRWYGYGYDFHVVGGGCVFMLTKDGRDEGVARWMQNVEKYVQTYNGTQTPLEDQDGTEYTYALSKSSHRVQIYKLSNGTKNLTVKVSYTTRQYGQENMSDPVAFYGEENGVYYYGTLEEYAEPDPQQLFSFGIAPYTEPAA